MKGRAWKRIPIVVSYAPKVIAACVAEIDRTYPLESGGVLMGTWETPTFLIIDAAIGPGPNAAHGRYSFRPDLEWQHNRIAELFTASHGKCTYLGDWHSHPGAKNGDMSSRDRVALETIMYSLDAQCPEPLMAIFWGETHDWRLHMWQGQPYWPHVPKLKSKLRLVDFRLANSP